VYLVMLSSVTPHVLQMYANFLHIKNFHTVATVDEIDGYEVMYEPLDAYEVVAIKLFD